MLGVCFDTIAPITRRAYGNENVLKDLNREEKKKKKNRLSFNDRGYLCICMCVSALEMKQEGVFVCVYVCV